MVTIQEISHYIAQFLNDMVDPNKAAFSLLISILLIVFTILVTIRVPVGRTLFIAFFSGLMFLMASQMQEMNYEFFISLGTELIAAILAIFIMPTGLVRVRWALPPVAIGVLIIPFILLALGFTEELVLSLRTDLLGGFLVFILLNRVWLVHRRKRPSERRQARQVQNARQRERVSRMEHEMIAQLQKSPHYDMVVMVRGTDPDDLIGKSNRIETLNNVSFKDAYYTKKRELGPVCIMMASLPTVGTPQLTIILEGQPEPVQYALSTCHDVFEVIDNHHQPGEQLAHARLTIQPPYKPFSEALYSQLAQVLTRQYQNHILTIDDQTAYRRGFDTGYKAAVEDLRQILTTTPYDERTAT